MKDLKNFSCVVILLAAGKSKRFNNKIKKQFLKLNGKTLVEYVFEKFAKLSYIKRFIVVVPKEDFKKINRIFEKKYNKLNFDIVIGGKERYDSVFNAGKYVDDETSCVIIHDVARPLVSLDLINRCVKEIENYDCVIPAIKVYDTIKLINSNLEVVKTLDREKLVLVQTPQVLKTEVFKKVYSKKNLLRWTKKYKITDDAQLVELQGYKVKVVAGDKNNIKITTKDDLNFIYK
ncbi:MAG: 2-C-methyl-D-erythritol 4-phosphate cytidylyltransferase [Endomicrobiia bacterium]